MAVVVPLPALDDGDFRADRPEEFFRGRGVGAVVADLQDVRTDIRPGGKQVFLRPLLLVAGKEEGRFAVVKPDDQRLVV